MLKLSHTFIRELVIFFLLKVHLQQHSDFGGPIFFNFVSMGIQAPLI
jgi:hypothetical protein